MLASNFKKSIDSLARVGRINKQWEVFFNLTYKCPLRCTYCYVDYSHAPPMTQEHIDYTFETLFVKKSNINIKLITFFGGEPALEIKLIEDTLEKWYHHPKMKNIHYGIITSFSVHQQRLLDLCKKFPLLELTISYDVEMSQRPYANKKAFKIFDVSKKKYNIDLNELSKISGNLMFAKTINGEEIDLFSDLIWLNDNFNRHGIFYALQINKTLKITDYKGKIEDAWYRYLKIVLTKFIEDGGRTYVPQLVHQFLTRYWKMEDNSAISGCGLGAEYFIDSNGTVSPCSISHHQTDLMISDKGKYLDNSEHFQELEEGYWNNPTCQSCQYKGFCPGGCMVFRWMEHKDYNKPNLGWCKFMAEFYNAYHRFLAELTDEDLIKLKNLVMVDYASCLEYCTDRSENINFVDKYTRVREDNAYFYTRDNLSENQS